MEYLIKAKFANKVQKEIALATLEQLLRGWLICTNLINKKNSVGVYITHGKTYTSLDPDGTKTVIKPDLLTQEDCEGVMRVMIGRIKGGF